MFQQNKLILEQLTLQPKNYPHQIQILESVYQENLLREWKRDP
jgi:hypothetical protein